MQCNATQRNAGALYTRKKKRKKERKKKKKERNTEEFLERGDIN
jgi:hypothetical protein